jgi:hypothetical protein
MTNNIIKTNIVKVWEVTHVEFDWEDVPTDEIPTAEEIDELYQQVVNNEWCGEDLEEVNDQLLVELGVVVKSIEAKVIGEEEVSFTVDL